jgi:hypothetical protein
MGQLSVFLASILKPLHMKHVSLSLLFLFFGYNQISAQVIDTVGNTTVHIDSIG